MTDRGKSYDDLSIEDILKPLSGKIQPEDAFKTWFGHGDASEARIMANQRNAVANKRYVNRTRKKRKGK